MVRRNQIRTVLLNLRDNLPQFGNPTADFDPVNINMSRDGTAATISPSTDLASFSQSLSASSKLDS